MKEQSVSTQSRHDDIHELVTYLHEEEVVYLDLTLLTQWEQALARWPLLSEWNQWAKKMGF